MANEVVKPDFSYQWASGGAIVAPSDVKVQTGWTAEVPPFQWENWSQNRQDNAILHLFQKGISEWDSASNYYFTASSVRSYVQGSDGQIYVAVQDSVGQNPTTDVTNTYWREAFRNQSGAPVYALDTGTANTYKADYVPVVKTLVDGMVLKFKALNANTAASTFTPANGVITAAPIIGGSHSALQGGEIVASGEVWLQWNSSVGGGSWVLVANSNGGLQVAAATKSLHAPQLGQVQGMRGMQPFFANGTFTVPANVTRIFYKAIGGGGGGGASLAANSSAGGGGSGAYAEGTLVVTPGQTIAITIGSGGAQGTSGNGGPGGSTLIGGFVSCPGGSGSASVSTAGIGQQGLGAVTSSGATVNSLGAPGSPGVFGSATAYFGGNGAASPFGGSLPGNSGYPGAGFGAYGAGGSGGANNNFGGNGTAGIVIINW